jgi:hypothetical protein
VFSVPNHTGQLQLLSLRENGIIQLFRRCSEENKQIIIRLLVSAAEQREIPANVIELPFRR